MELYEAIAKRRTVREFKPDPVPEDLVRRALAAGLRAPCNAHLKSWEFVLLRDRAKRIRAVREELKARDMKGADEIERFVACFPEEELKEVYRRSLPLQQTMMLQAPEVLLVCFRMKPLAACRTLFELNPLASVWMCIENILLALVAEGVFGCTYTPYDAQGLKTFLALPAGYEVAAVVPFGYPLREPEAAPEENLDGRLHMDGWQDAE